MNMSQNFQWLGDTIKILNKKLSIVFPEDEIARIALHYINAKVSMNYQKS